ncbi:hypothetical protein DUPY_37590 [Duganella phyllosphaerae]|uniref:Uncharacterized protein n=1 Tax=Duganella phyllosphaerae TaxID=762836 RepID=A0A1E7WF61_9BURK|nr:hypothetical protein DUPY_37590 [Duganella phyllosphaerae]
MTDLASVRHLLRGVPDHGRQLRHDGLPLRHARTALALHVQGCIGQHAEYRRRLHAQQRNILRYQLAPHGSDHAVTTVPLRDQRQGRIERRHRHATSTLGRMRIGRTDHRIGSHGQEVAKRCGIEPGMAAPRLGHAAVQLGAAGGQQPGETLGDHACERSHTR